MKTNEVPEKLYIALDEFTEDDRTFVLDHRTDYPICTEYIRTDAFIEKALEWIRENIRPYYHEVRYKYEDFKKYMERK